MPATATLNARVSAEDKSRFTSTAAALGLTPSAAINVFVRRFNDAGGFPFDVRVQAAPLGSEAEACELADALSREMVDGAW